MVVQDFERLLNGHWLQMRLLRTFKAAKGSVHHRLGLTGQYRHTFFWCCYTKITQLKAFCLRWHDGTSESFPRRLPFLSWSSRPCIASDPCSVAHDDAEDTNAKHSNFKAILCNKTKTPQLILPYCGYSLSNNSISSWRAFVEILLYNLGQNLQLGQLHHWATSKGAEIYNVTVHGNSFLSRNFESLSRDFSTISRNSSGPSRVYPALSRDYVGLSRDYSAHSREYASLFRIMHNAVCFQHTTQSLQFHGDYRRVPLLTEWKQTKNHLNYHVKFQNLLRSFPGIASRIATAHNFTPD